MKNIIKYFSEVETSLLFVDDDIEILEQITALLKVFKLKVTSTTNPLKAVELCENRNFDIVISDIEMPKMNGLELSAKIKEKNNDILIILISGFNEVEYFKEAINIGIDSFIPKPVELHLLGNALKKYIKEDRIKRELNIKNQYFDVVYNNYLISKTDLNGVIIDVNDIFCRVTGYSREELIGNKHNIIKSPKTKPEIFKELWKTISSGKVFKSVIVDRVKSGKDIILNVIIMPIFSKRGKIIEYLAIRQDVTQEEFLREKLINEENQKKMNEKEKKLREEFLTIFTHELKTPLNAIINFNQYIRDNLFKEDKKELLLELTSHIDENSTLLLSQVEDMLSIQKLKDNKLEFLKKEFNLKEVLYEARNKISNLKVNFESIEDVIIKSDKLKVEQIILNILSNAQKYANGEVYINLKTKNGKWQIQIDDNGNGIKDKKHIFDLYYQEDDQILTREKRGTGIGLYTVKKLCEKLGIKIYLKDGRVGGALFILQANIKTEGKK